MMTLAKRLHEDDAKGVFESIADNEEPPQGLDFKIIRVPKNGLKLSPPSLDFDCGLYVLLRSPTNNASETSVPSKLRGKVQTDSDLACCATCPWSLSGPQQGSHTQIQQRYCYPRGQHKYSSKGAAVWTKIDERGKENIDCRIFHVYLSSKRSRTPSPKSQVIIKTSKSTGGSTHESKRKNIREGPENKKTQKVVACMIQSLSPSLEGDILKSPQTKISFDLDSKLNFNSNNIFDAEGVAPTGQSFSPFVPVHSKDVDERVLHAPMSSTRPLLHPAFNSTANVPENITQQKYAAPNVHYYGHYVRCPPHAYGGRHAHAGYSCDGTIDAPSIPLLTSLEQERKHGKGGATLSLNEFSKRLQDMGEKITRDVHRSVGVDGAQKLHLLQQWAKGIAVKPLLKISTTNTKVEIKSNGSLGTPGITP